jgi:hypothetical protein
MIGDGALYGTTGSELASRHRDTLSEPSKPAFDSAGGFMTLAG